MEGAEEAVGRGGRGTCERRDVRGCGPPATAPWRALLPTDAALGGLAPPRRCRCRGARVGRGEELGLSAHQEVQEVGTVESGALSGVGDADLAALVGLHEVEGEVAQDGHVGRGVLGAMPGPVLAKGHVEDRALVGRPPPCRPRLVLPSIAMCLASASRREACWSSPHTALSTLRFPRALPRGPSSTPTPASPGPRRARGDARPGRRPPGPASRAPKALPSLFHPENAIALQRRSDPFGD